MPRVVYYVPGCACQVFKKFLWLGRFGGGSPKPTNLYSNAKWLSELDGSKPVASGEKSVTTTRYTDREGRRRCTGTKFLKGTQPVPRYVE
jgi:hypothetical protein